MHIALGPRIKRSLLSFGTLVRVAVGRVDETEWYMNSSRAWKEKTNANRLKTPKDRRNCLFRADSSPGMDGMNGMGLPRRGQEQGLRPPALFCACACSLGLQTVSMAAATGFCNNPESIEEPLSAPGLPPRCTPKR